MQVMVNADAPVVIRRNRFRNTYHAIAMLGRNVHFLDNDVSALEPERVPFGWPSLAGPGFWLTLGGWPAANGTGIWLSKGSEGNTLSANVVSGGR